MTTVTMNGATETAMHEMGATGERLPGVFNTYWSELFVRPAKAAVHAGSAALTLTRNFNPRMPAGTPELPPKDYYNVPFEDRVGTDRGSPLAG